MQRFQFLFHPINFLNAIFCLARYLPNYTESDSKFGILAKPAPQFFDRRSSPCVEHMVDADDQKTID